MKVNYHIPRSIEWNVEPPSDERTRLERVIFLAIERAVRGRAHVYPGGRAIGMSGSQGDGESTEFPGVKLKAKAPD